MYRKFRGKFVEVWASEKGKKLTPKNLADLLPRPEFEALAPNYGPERRIEPKDKRFTAWDLSQQVNKLRGVRGHTVKVTMTIKDGKQFKHITFYRRAKRKGDLTYGFFRQANAAVGNDGAYLYNRIGSKLFPDRKGRKVKLVSYDVSVEM